MLECRVCGGKKFSEGQLEGHAAVRPTGKFLSSSSLILNICQNCGEVVSMKVKKLHIFQDK